MALLRAISATATPVYETAFSKFPFNHKYDIFSYLGMVKNKPHYYNLYNEVYISHGMGELEYVADWLEEYKMLWTDYPVTYRLITVQKKDYFFDVNHHDTYAYDYNKKLVYPVGYYCPKKHIITKN